MAEHLPVRPLVETLMEPFRAVAVGQVRRIVLVIGDVLEDVLGGVDLGDLFLGHDLDGRPGNRSHLLAKAQHPAEIYHAIDGTPLAEVLKRLGKRTEDPLQALSQP